LTAEETEKNAKKEKRDREEFMDSEDEMMGMGKHRDRGPRKITVYKVLLICNSDYDPSLVENQHGKYYPLPSCEDDLKMMLDWIDRSYWCKCKYIISKNASREELAKIMADFKADCDAECAKDLVEDVVVLVYYTGHGAMRNEGGYLSTYIVHKEFDSYTNILWLIKNLSCHVKMHIMAFLDCGRVYVP